MSGRRVARGQASATARAAPVWTPWVGSTAAWPYCCSAPGLVLAGCGGGGGGSGRPGSGASAPTTTAPTAAKSCLKNGEQAFSIPAADGPTTGVALGQGRTGVVLGHQAGSDLCEWLPQARRLATHGRQVLNLRLRAAMGPSPTRQEARGPGGRRPRHLPGRVRRPRYGYRGVDKRSGHSGAVLW